MASFDERLLEIEGDATKRAVWPCNYGQTAWPEGDRAGGNPTNPIILLGPPLVCLYNYPVALLRWGLDEAPVPILGSVRHFVRSTLRP